jgi:dGTPase
MPELKPSDIHSDELSPGEIKEICQEISARNMGKLTELSPFATKNEEAIRQEPNDRRNEEYAIAQNPFEVDWSRGAYSDQWMRMSRTTQVHTNPVVDNVHNRMTHMIGVGSSLSRSIARSLGHNPDLAVAIGDRHDIGHAFFGHTGEVLLTQAMLEIREDLLAILGPFKHNIQGVHVIDRIATRKGYERQPGLNLTDQTRHGILSHDGEAFTGVVKPVRLKPEELDRDIQRYIQDTIQAAASVPRGFDLKDEKTVEAYLKAVDSAVRKVIVAPATIEACIVFMADSLHYIPTDFEDFIDLGFIRREQIPARVAQKLGDNSGTMIHTLVNNLLIHSYGKDRIGYSQEVAEIVLDFKKNFLYPLYFRVNDMIIEGTDDERFALPKKGQARMAERAKKMLAASVQAAETPQKFKDSPLVTDFLRDKNVPSYYRKMRHLADDRHKIYQAAVDYVAGLSDHAFIRGAEGLLDKP